MIRGAIYNVATVTTQLAATKYPMSAPFFAVVPG